MDDADADRNLRMFQLLECLRSVCTPPLTLNQLSVLFYVAAHDGCNQQDIVKATGLTEASVSRNVDRLSPRQPDRQDGLGFCKREIDPDCYKAFRIFLTPKGSSYLEATLEVLYED